LALAGVAVAALLVAPDTARSFDVVRYEEATIADIHAALSANADCRTLVRCTSSGSRPTTEGPALNAIVVTNPDALKLADTLDARFAIRTGQPAPLRAPHREGQLRDHRHVRPRQDRCR
jgi:hypothetical protein